MQSHPHQIIGYHSCDKEVGLSILRGEQDLKQSENSWDWLGHGTYFWEDNPIRALEYAKEVAIGSQFNQKAIQKPFVLGAIIELGKCLNLLSPESLPILKNAYDILDGVKHIPSFELLKNDGDNRALDCRVIRLAVQIMKQTKGAKNYDTVRTAFDEGDNVYPGSTFTTRQHIQVCVINPKVIKGYFLPRPLKKYNPDLFKK